MTSPHDAPSVSFLRVICLVVCYSLVLSLLVFPRPRAVWAGAAPTGPAKSNVPRGTLPAQQKPRWRDGEVLVRFRQDLPAPDVEVLLNANGAKRAGRLRGKSGVERLRLAAGANPEDAAAALLASGSVEVAEPNYLIAADQIFPSDPRFPEQWALGNDAAAAGQFGSGINARQGWQLSTGSPQTVIAVLDSGVDFTHPDLVNNEWANSAEVANGLDDDKNGLTDDLRGWDFVTNSGQIKDGNGHGTAVAGIIAAEGNNATGVAGVMWRAGLMSLRVLDDSGAGDVAAAAEAIEYAAEKGAQVINCSWGTNDSSAVLLGAIRRASRRGVIVVAAAGNEGRDVETAPRYPASFYGDNLIAVASTDNLDQLAAWSNWGANHVTICAPGVDVLTTKAGGDYQSVSGSSASAPLVTGVVGLVKTLRPWLGSERTRAMLILGARRNSSLSGKVFSGGVVSAAGSLGALDTLAPGEGLDASNGNNGGTHDETKPVPGADAGGRIAIRDEGEFNVTPPEPARGAPRRNLPNLDDLRNKQPALPKARPPVPAKRCSHQDPHCQRRRRAEAAPFAPGLLPGRMLAWSLQMPDVGPLLKEAAGLVSDSSSPLAIFSSAPAPLPLPPPVEEVVWTKAVGVNVMGNSLKKTAAAGWNAGASSTRSIAAGDGYVEFTVSETNTNRMAGLSNGDENQNYTEIDFAIYAHATGVIYVEEGGSAHGPYGSYAVGDKLRVAVENGLVKYYKNSTLLYTSGNAPLYPLLVDTSFHGGGSTITGAVISGMLQGNTPAEDVFWTNVVPGVTASGNDLTKTAATAWGNAGAVSIKTIPFGDGYVEWTASETDTSRAIGLGNGDTSQGLGDIAFAFYMYASSNALYVYESGSGRGIVGSYATGDRLRVAVEDRVVTYWKNGELLYKSNLTAKYPLLADTALYTTGATITDVVISHEPNNGQAGANYLGARLDPVNRTGRSGVDLQSGNVNWSVPILSLPGRADFDLGLSLTYNSLVWTKAGATMMFDADRGSPSPGFRLGFPVIEAPYYNDVVEANAYLLITPSGSRIELRQVGTTNIYEAADSSYLQLTDNGNDTLLLKDTGGNQFSYALAGGQYRCEQLTDRNGNFISVTYNDDGQINTITDTLARTITFNYDSEFHSLVSIWQTWTDVELGISTQHVWATFGWGDETIDTTFTNMAVVGPQDNSTVRVLKWVYFPDGTIYTFDYNTRLQVSKFTRKYPHETAFPGYNPIEDDVPSAYTSYVYSTTSTDCPRPTQERIWAKDWNGDEDGVAASTEEAATTYTLSLGNYGEARTPDTTYYKELFDTTPGWKKGLLTGTQIRVGSTVMKSTAITWTQDDTSLLFQKNARVTEQVVTDNAGNSRKTAITYYPEDSFSLPENVYEYGADGNILRRTHTMYNTATVYKSRRIIGLPIRKTVYAGETTTASKITYEYDEGGNYFVNQGAATNHDSAGYPATFRVGRGNLTSVRRWNAQYPTDGTKTTETNLGYNNSGSVILTRNALGQQTAVEYNDAFSDSTKNNLATPTLAYPTKVTPPLATGETAASLASTTQYNYDFGGVTRTQGPIPAGQTAAPAQTFKYDLVGRIAEAKNLVNNAYTTWNYHPKGIVSTKTLTQPKTVVVFSTTVSDGVGRPIVRASDNSSTAGEYRGQAFFYDVMGRPSKQSNPAQIDGQWQPTGNDPWANGEDGNVWVFTLQTYDWKGRPILTTNQDGTTKMFTYGGCGCAGGEVVTMRDEASSGGRIQKSTADDLGRPWKTEVLNWADASGNRPVYATTINVYNALDQLTELIEQANPSGTSQSTITEYDGYGRVLRKKAPEAATNGYTTFEYYADDSLKKVTDARGAITNYVYNVRGLVTDISYTAPSGVAATAGVTFTYDPAGNRTSMEDELGHVDYEYDGLSQLLSETRQFTGVTNPTSGSAGKYKLAYTYTLSGSVKSITDPFNYTIDYAYDKVERVTGVSGTAFAGLTQYASQIQYRAWGVTKEVTYGDGLKATFQYNKRLTPAQYELKDASNVLLMGAAYQYYSDGRLKFVDDLREPRLDRQYKYDHMGRVTEAESGYLARDAAYPGNNTQNGPYNHYYGYDQFNHMTSRTGSYWHHESGEVFTATYLNNRNQNAGWLYDADGRLTQSQTTGSAGTFTTAYTYDAAGRRADAGKYDGDGQQAKSPDGKMYYVRSSVLGGLSITEVHSELQAAPLPGTKSSTFVYLDGEAIAEQYVSSATGTIGQPRVKWRRTDPADANVHLHDAGLPTSTGGQVQMALDIQGIATEVPDYASLQQNQSYYNQSYSSYNYGGYGSGYGGGGNGTVNGYSSGYGGGGMPGNFGHGCTLDGAIADCDFMVQMWNGGGAHQCPPSGCGPRMIRGQLFPFNPATGGWGPDWQPDSTKQEKRQREQRRRDRIRYTPARRPPRQTNPFSAFASPTQLSDEDCDKKLSKIFGGYAKAMVNSDLKAPNGRGAEGHSAAARNDKSEREYDTYNQKWKRRADRGGIIHTYTDSSGTARTDTKLFTPAGWNGKAIPYIDGQDNAGLIFNYPGGITIEFVHVGTFNDNGIPSSPRDVGNKEGLVEIGFVGGEGGEGEGYHHTHIVFFSDKAKNVRIDPRVLFCGFPAK